MVLKQYGAGSELVHCHVTLTVETFVTRAVTSVGVGGAEGVMMQKVNKAHVGLWISTVSYRGRFRIFKRGSGTW